MKKYIYMLALTVALTTTAYSMQKNPPEERKSSAADKASKEAATRKALKDATEKKFAEALVAFVAAQSALDKLAQDYTQQQWDTSGVSALSQQAADLFLAVLKQTQNSSLVGQAYYYLGRLALQKNSNPGALDKKPAEAQAFAYFEKVFETNTNFDNEQERWVYQHFMGKAALQIAQLSQKATKIQAKYAELAIKHSTDNTIKAQALEILAWLYLRGSQEIPQDFAKAQEYAHQAAVLQGLDEEHEEPASLIKQCIDAQRELDRAEQYLQEQDYNRAERHTLEAFRYLRVDLNEEPPYFDENSEYADWEHGLAARGFLYLGKMLLAQQNLNDAKAVLEEALDLNKEDTSGNKQSVAWGKEIMTLLQEVNELLKKQTPTERKVAGKRKDHPDDDESGPGAAKRARKEGDKDVSGAGAGSVSGKEAKATGAAR